MLIFSPCSPLFLLSFSSGYFKGALSPLRKEPEAEESAADLRAGAGEDVQRRRVEAVLVVEARAAADEDKDLRDG